MSLPPPSQSSRIIVVGASPFGLSTALHLLARGYTSILLLDRRRQPHPSRSPCPYAPLHYTSSHHALSLSALKQWTQWNEDLWSRDDMARLWINNGFYAFFPASVGGIPEVELQRIAYVERRHGLKLGLLASCEMDHVDSATSRMFCIDPFRCLEEGGGEGGGGVLDTMGGTILVDAAWEFALAKARKEPGIQMVFDDSQGCVEQILFEASPGGVGQGEKIAHGVETKDGKFHPADLVIWACDPSSVTSFPSLPPPTQPSTTETVFQIPISPDENPDLWDRLSEDNFPSWTHTLPYSPTAEAEEEEEEGEERLLGFPRDSQGSLRIVWRGPPPSPAAKGKGRQSIEDFLTRYLPDLVPAFQKPETRAESELQFHNRTVVDRLPGVNNMLLALDEKTTMQSFMFLPVIGGAVVDILEGGPHAVKGWRWPRQTGRASRL